MRDLIAILDDGFAEFLNKDHYQSIPMREGRPSCLHSVYGEWNSDRPLFNHKDPTNSGDYEYYLSAISRFRASANDGAILFVFDESGESETLFNALVEVVDRRYPRLIVRALRHRSSNSRDAQLVRLQAIGVHELWRFDGSPVIGGVALKDPQDERLIVDEMLSLR